MAMIVSSISSVVEMLCKKISSFCVVFLFIFLQLTKKGENIFGKESARDSLPHCILIFMSPPCPKKISLLVFSQIACTTSSIFAVSYLSQVM